MEVYDDEVVDQFSEEIGDKYCIDFWCLMTENSVKLMFLWVIVPKENNEW